MYENPEPISNNLVFIQNWLRPALTPVLKNCDHKRLVEELTLLDQTIKATGLETKAIAFVTHRRLAVGWSVLVHNLTWIVRTVREQQQARPAKAA